MCGIWMDVHVWHFLFVEEKFGLQSKKKILQIPRSSSQGSHNKREKPLQ